MQQNREVEREEPSYEDMQHELDRQRQELLDFLEELHNEESR